MGLICKYGEEELIDIISNQVCAFWKIDISEKLRGGVLLKALNRFEKCMAECSNKYINSRNRVEFRLTHSVSYTIFLYLLSNQLFIQGDEDTATYIYYLNKIMHSVDWFYAINLPDIFMAEHPLGSVLGRAKYGDYFMIYQGCTVGGNRNQSGLFYPELKNHVIMYANSTVIGKTHIGSHVVVSSGAYLKDEVVPDNCIVFGQSPDLIIKRKKPEEMNEMFKHIWRTSII